MGIALSTNGVLPRLARSRGDAGIVERRPGVLPLALCLLFATPLGFGVLSVSSGLKLSNRASHFARDVASMYRQGVDFSRPESQGMVFDLARARGLPIRPENAVVILSTIRKVSDADCAAAGAGGACANRGFAVLERQVLLGNPRLHASNFGAVPATALQASLNDRAARVRDFGDAVPAGEEVWAAETWFATTDQPAGIYVRSID